MWWLTGAPERRKVAIYVHSSNDSEEDVSLANSMKLCFFGNRISNIWDMKHQVWAMRRGQPRKTKDGAGDAPLSEEEKARTTAVSSHWWTNSGERDESSIDLQKEIVFPDLTRTQFGFYGFLEPALPIPPAGFRLSGSEEEAKKTIVDDKVKAKYWIYWIE